MFTTHKKHLEIPPPELFREGFYQWRRCYLELNIPWFIVDLGLNWGAYFDRLGGYQVIIPTIHELHAVILENRGTIEVSAVFPRMNTREEGIQIVKLKEIWEMYDFEGDKKTFYETIYIGMNGEKYSYPTVSEGSKDRLFKEVIVI